MCVVLAALDMLNAKPELNFSVHLSILQTFSWLTIAGLIGVLLAVPLRRHYIDEENLTFADGMAAGQALLVLDQGPKEAGPRVTALSVGHVFIWDCSQSYATSSSYFPDSVAFGSRGEALRMGTEVSLLSFGSGMLVGPRIAISMGARHAGFMDHRAAGARLARNYSAGILRTRLAMGHVACHRIHGGWRSYRTGIEMAPGSQNVFESQGKTNRIHRLSFALRHRRSRDPFRDAVHPPSSFSWVFLFG